MQAIGIDVWDGSSAQVESFKDDTGIKYPLLLNGLELAGTYGVSNDYSMVIDHEGIVRHKGGGVDLNQIHSAIDQSLATALHSKENKAEKFQLKGNYPNPFNPATQIYFTLNRTSEIQLQIFDVQGRLVRHLLKETLSPGEHSVRWDGRSDKGRLLPSGVYIYQLRGEKRKQSKRMLLIR